MKPTLTNCRAHLQQTAFGLGCVLATASIGSIAAAVPDLMWDGDTNSALELGTNWSTDTAPVAGQVMGWDGSEAGPLVLVYGDASLGGAPPLSINVAATQTDSLSIDSAANLSAIRLDEINLEANSGAFTLGDGADEFNITIGNASGQIHYWTNAGSNAATVNSDVDLGLGGGGDHAVRFGGDGDWIFSAPYQPDNGANLSIQKVGSGTLTLSGGGSLQNGVNAFGGVFRGVLKEGVTRISGGTYEANSGEFVVGGLDVVGTDTELILDGGSLTGVTWMSIGRGNGTGATSSDVTLNNDATLTSANLSMGFNGGDGASTPKGSITLNDDSVQTVTSNNFFLAESAGSDMSIDINGSAQLNAQQIQVGMGGAGAINVTGSGKLTAGGELRIGYENGTGTVSVSGGTVDANALIIARGLNNASTATGTVTVTGGTLTSVNDLIVGYAGADNLGKLVINGGTVNVGTTATKWLQMSRWDTADSQMDIDSGALNLNSNTSITYASGNNQGVNVVNLNGGTITTFSDNATTPLGAGRINLNQAGGAAVNNTFNLNGGILTVRSVQTNSDTGTAAFNFNGGTLKATGNETAFVALGGATQSVNVLTGGAIIDSNGFDVVIPESLQSGGADGGLTKLGTGSLTLTGGNAYTGPTLVSGGALMLDGGAVDSSSGIEINGAGAKLTLANNTASTVPVTIVQGSLDLDGSLGTVTVADDVNNTVTTGNGASFEGYVDTLTFQGAATVSVQATGSTADRYFDVATALNTTGPGIVVNGVNTTGFWESGVDYPVIVHNNNGTFDLTHFTLGTLDGLLAFQTAELVNDGGQIAIRVSGEALEWTGNVSSDWSIGGDLNWDLGGAEDYMDGDSAYFGDGAASTSVNIAGGDVAPGSVIFENDFDDYTLSSAGGFGITGASTVIKNAGGKLTVSTDNDYTGATFVNDGTFEITGSGSIADSSSIVVGDFADLVFSPSGATADYTASISGSGSITLDGAGTLTLSGDHSGFDGDFFLDNGTLNLNGAQVLGTGVGAFEVSGGTIDNTSGGDVILTGNKPQYWNADINFTGSNSLWMGSGDVTLLPGGASLSVNVAANTLGVGRLNGAAFAVVKNGAGTLAITQSGTASQIGVLDIQAGTVAFNTGAAVGTTTDLNIAGLTGTGVLQNGGGVERWTYVTVADGEEFTFDGTTVNGAAGGMGFRKLGPGKQTMTGVLSHTGRTSIAGGELVLTNPANAIGGQVWVEGGQLTISGGLGANAANGAFTVGRVAGTPAVMNILPGADIVRHNLFVGDGGAGTGGGAVYQTGGDLELTQGGGIDNVRIGSNTGGYGYYSISGGSLTSNEIGLGASLGDTVGVLEVSGMGQVVTNGWVTIGRGADTSSGLLNMTGGSFTAVRLDNSWGATSQSVINVANASLNITGAGAGLALTKTDSAGTVGIANLLPGGTLSTTIVRADGPNAYAAINFDGGTLRAQTTNSGVNFLNAASVDALNVHDGGGTIDNNDTNITIGRPLSAPIGEGVALASIPVPAGGDGYSGAPLLRFTGGTGQGATGYAVVTAGVVTDIVVTSPGTGYTAGDLLTATFSGGGYTTPATAVTDIAVAPNASGGMTFVGGGVTTLAAENSFAGNTTVGAGSVVVSATGSLLVAPTANGVSNKITGAGTLSFQGALNIDLGGADATDGNSWVLVDTATKVFDPVSFSVPGFTQSSDVWTMTDGLGNTWTFTEATGVLTVSVPALAGYDDWLTGYPGMTLTGREEDNDGDSIANVLEFYLGLDPTVADLGGLPDGSLVGGNFILVFNRSDEAEGDTTQNLQYGNDLSGWTSVVIPAASGVVDGVTFTVDENGAASDTITASIPTGGAATFFGRLDVE